MSDVIGPVALDVVSSLPTLPCLADKIMWWGKRGNRAGGPAMSEDEDDEVEDDDDAEAPDDSVALPISHHCLPLAVITDLVDGVRRKACHRPDADSAPVGYQVAGDGLLLLRHVRLGEDGRLLERATGQRGLAAKTQNLKKHIIIKPNA